MKYKLTKEQLKKVCGVAIRVYQKYYQEFKKGSEKEIDEILESTVDGILNELVGKGEHK